MRPSHNQHFTNRHPVSLKILYIALAITILFSGWTFCFNQDSIGISDYCGLAGAILKPIVFPIKTLRDDYHLPTQQAGSIYCLGLFLVHYLLLRHCRFLNTHSARRLAWLIAIVIPFQLIDWQWFAWSHNPWSLLPGLLVPVFLITLTGFTVFSTPVSSRLGVLPLFLNYLFLQFFFYTIQGDDNELSYMHYNLSPYQIYLYRLPYSLLMFLLFLAILPVSARIFPKHRRLRELWSPAPLPRLGPVLKPVQSFTPDPPRLAPEDEY